MRRLLPFATVCCLLSVLPPLAAAQTNTRPRTTQPPGPQTTSPNTPAPINADEDFELNITERRITEPDFFASTSVAVGDERIPLLRVGVALGADGIDVLLRNVRGHVRFRASLARVQRVLDERRAQPAPPVP